MNRHHQIEDETLRQVVYSIPGMEQTQIRKNITYKTIDEVDLHLDIYYPAHYQRHTALPAVIFIHGDGPTPYLQHIKESGQYSSWGKLVAASGLIAVVANRRSTDGLSNVVGVANDIDDLISYVRDHSYDLNINPDTLGIWTCSAGACFALRSALYEAAPFVRAIVCYYGFVELKAYYAALYEQPDSAEETTTASAQPAKQQPQPTFSEDDFDEFSATELLLRRTSEPAPLFIARAGLDYPVLNVALDHFISEAIAQNTMVTVMNHPTGQHGFDVEDRDIRSEEIIAATLEFLQTHLLQ